MGLLDWALPAAGVFNQRRAGQQQGQMDAYLFQRKQEEEDRQAQQAALQQQLLQLQIAKAQQPDAWAPTDEASYMRVHPHNAPTTENIDPLSDAGISAALKRRRGEAAIDRANPKPPGADEQQQEAEGLAILSQTAGPKQQQAFGAAFQAVRARHKDWSPGKVAYQAYKGALSVDPTIKPGRNDDQTFTTNGVTAGDASNADPAASPVVPPPVTAKIAPDAHQQEAMAQRWDELTAGGMDPEQAKAQVLREFGGQ